MLAISAISCLKSPTQDSTLLPRERRPPLYSQLCYYIGEIGILSATLKIYRRILVFIDDFENISITRQVLTDFAVGFSSNGPSRLPIFLKQPFSTETGDIEGINFIYRRLRVNF